MLKVAAQRKDREGARQLIHLLQAEETLKRRTRPNCLSKGSLKRQEATYELATRPASRENA